jgi:hypothetical protein
MSKCRFTFSITQPVDTLLDNARRQIVAKGGRFNGDATKGSFNGSTPFGAIEASYTIVGQELIISIEKKPLLVSCKRIEQALAGNFANQL